MRNMPNKYYIHRAYSKIRNCWFYGSFHLHQLNDSDNEEEKDFEPVLIIDNLTQEKSKTLQVVHNIAISSVGQFTGKFDKNNVKIFEGDIVEFDYYKDNEIIKMRGLIYWNEIKSTWYITMDKNKRINFTDFLERKSCVVIGNNFENPKLLEVANE